MSRTETSQQLTEVVRQMKKIFQPATLLLLGAFTVLVTGCACAKPKPSPPPEVKAAPAPAPTPVPVKQEEFKPAPVEKSDDLGDLDLINKAGYLKDTFFDFDKFNVRADQRDGLAADAEWLKKYQKVQVRVEGHCDERGTAQYNMALGEKRASAVKDYLTSLGIDAGRIETVSYGKEKPFVKGHNEEAWAQNRRGHFVITAK
jgi:peptidoglycan-associated lipoprotein